MILFLCLMRTSSACDASVPLRSRRFRLASFFVRMWLLNARRRRTRPVPVSLKRFAAAFLVFFFTVAPLSLGPEQHGHVPALEPRLLLDLAEVGERLRHAVEHHFAELGVGHLPAPEHHN